MAFELQVHNIPGLTAGADLSLKQYLAMKLVGDLSINTSGAGEESIGILQNDPSLGQAATLMNKGVSKAYYGDTVTAGQSLAADASGKLVPAASGDFVVAVALEGGAVGEVRTVEVQPANVPLA